MQLIIREIWQHFFYFSDVQSVLKENKRVILIFLQSDI